VGVGRGGSPQPAHLHVGAGRVVGQGGRHDAKQRRARCGRQPGGALVPRPHGHLRRAEWGRVGWGGVGWGGVGWGGVGWGGQ
jgi:hypothetical protein